MSGKNSFLSLLLLLLAMGTRGAVTNAWVYYGTNGGLNYQTWGNGNQIMDFSGAGYMGGGVAIPTNIVVKTNLSAVAGDNTASIQNAINYVSGLTPNASGFRGAVLLNPGTFNVSSQINISASGVVVWGSGSGPGGTTIVMTNANAFTLFNLAGSGGPSQGSAVAITDPYVPSGTTTFHIASGTSPIIWGTNNTVAADSDIFTNGTLLYAYNWSGTNQTVNGITFTGTSSANPGNASISGIGSNYHNYSSGSAPFSSLSPEYRDLLCGGEYSSGTSTATVTLNSLTAGRVYAVQFWVSDPRGGGTIGRTDTVSGSNEVVLAYNVPAATGGVGQYSIGVFAATGSSQSFSFVGSASTQINALLVSDVTTTGYQPLNPPATLPPSAFSAGETVMINRTVTTNWINYMGMTPGGGSIQTNELWISPGSVITTDRIIKQAAGNVITLDAPLTDSFDTNYLGTPAGTIAPYTWSGRISQVGLEHIFIQAPPENNLGYTAVTMGNIIDSWVRDINIQDGNNSFTVNNSAKHCTVDTVSITHTVAMTGDPPADYTVTGTQVLINKCSSASSGEWPFVTQGEGTGPIVALNFYSTANRGMEPHQRWSTGLLCDNCSLPDCPRGEQGVAFFNRGSDGSGHGWDMGWGVAWNCETPYILMTVAPGTENWVIGGIAQETTDGSQVNGIYNQLGNIVTPQSLYLAQLKQRLGPAALQNIGYTVFTVSASPATASVMTGSNAVFSLKVAGTNGFSDRIGLGLSGVPSGVGVQFSTNAIAGSGAATLTLAFSNSAVAGNYPLTVSGIDGNLTNFATINLSIAKSPPSAPPRFALPTFIGGNLVFSGSNGVADGPFYVLASTNLELPLTNWTMVSSNSFDGSGNFNVTNPVNRGGPPTFYILQEP